MWDKEDKSVVAKIKEEMDKQKLKERIDVSGKDLGKLGEEQTPEEYDKWVVPCHWLGLALTGCFKEL